jgi:UDP-N-acetylglucosamine:LPS N-acetylglucosamine transferase
MTAPPAERPRIAVPVDTATSAPALVAGASVVIVSGSVGAGHDGVAHELARRLTAEGHRAEVLDMLEGFPWLVGVILGSAYLFTLRVAPLAYEVVCWLVERSARFQRLADVLCRSAIPWLRTKVRDADVVVATYPPAGRALGRMRETGDLQVPVVTYLTDPAPNYLWQHPHTDVHLTMSQATADEAEQRYGLPMQIAGPLVSPVFRTTDRIEARRHLREVAGTAPDAKIALMVLGSLGMGDVRPALRALRAAGAVPVVLCGRNEKLLRDLGSMPGIVALGWRTDAAQLVAGCDLVVHNAGGLSLTESLVAGVPSLTFRPIRGHGRANARTLDRSGLVRWAKTPEDLTRLARAVLNGPHATVRMPEETAVERICALLPTAESDQAA